MRYSVLVAVGDAGRAHYIEHLLQRQTTFHLGLNMLADPYTLLESCKEVLPDLLIVSPDVVSDPMVPILKEALGNDELRIVSYCTTLAEAELSKNFDGKILSTDGGNEVSNMLESVLEVDGSNAEEMMLTPREQEVVVAVVKGLTNKEIAEKFFLSTHTIITHRRNIARKLNIHSPSGLTIYAIMNKLVTLDDVKDHI